MIACFSFNGYIILMNRDIVPKVYYRNCRCNKKAQKINVELSFHTPQLQDKTKRHAIIHFTHLQLQSTSQKYGKGLGY